MTTTLSRTSMQDIAEKAGVSVMTVSRVLRNHPGHKEETRKKVLSVSKELGYSKHPLVSALMTELRNRRSSIFAAVIAYIHCHPAHRKPQSSWVAIMNSIRKQAAQQGYELEEFSLFEPGMTPKRLVDILKARGIRGCILEPFIVIGTELTMDLSHFASVAIGHSLSRPNLHRVEKDEYVSTLNVISKLQGLGYKRIGLALHSINESNHQFKRGAALATAQNIISPENRIPPLLFYKLKSLRKELKPWLEEHNPDVVIAHSIQVLEAMQSYGYRIPDDIGYAQLDLLPGESGIAGIDPNWEQLGEIAANQVIDQMNRNEFGIPENPIESMINGKWIEGDTIRKQEPSPERYASSRDQLVATP